jgi:uncharacterized membrane protein YcaP (DUF421 family)
MFFSGWSSLFRTLVVGTLAYVTLVLFLRVSGKRTLSKLNAFDLIVTVSLGSTLATVLLSRDVSLADGAMAFALLIGLQFLVTWSSVRVQWVRALVTGEPSLLLFRGELLETALRRTRVTRDDVHAAIREAGHLDVRDVEAVVLETDGSITVMKRGADQSAPDSVSSLQDVRRHGR